MINSIDNKILNDCNVKNFFLFFLNKDFNKYIIYFFLKKKKKKKINFIMISYLMFFIEKNVPLINENYNKYMLINVFFNNFKIF